MKEKVIRIEGHLRYFIVEILLEKEKENVEDLLHNHLNNLMLYDNEEERYRKLYLEENLKYYLPIEILQPVIASLRVLYPDRENYELVNMPSYAPDKIDLKMNKEFVLRDYQQQYHDLIVNGKERSIFVDLRTGSGKASWINSKVMTINGWKLLKDIEVGDELWSIDGKRNLVKQIFPQGKKKLYKITTDNNRSHICCGDHLWECKVDDSYVVMDLNDIRKVYDKVDIEIPYILHEGHLRLDDGIGTTNETIKNYVSDLGCLNDEQMLGNLSKLPSAIVSQRLIAFTYLFHPDNCTLLHGNGSTLFEIISHNRNIETVKVFRDIALSLGFHSDYWVNDNLRVVLHIVLPKILSTTQEVIDFLASQDFTGYNIRYTKIIKIEEFMEDEAICLKVSHPESLYVVDDYLVTHNTVIASSAVCTMGKRIGVIVLPRYIDKWKDDFVKYTNLKPERLFIVQGSKALDDLLEHYEDYDAIIFSMRTLYNHIKKFTTGLPVSISPTELFTKLKIGVLLSDESHQELNSLFTILTYNDVPKVIGMSATFVSDRRDERRIQEMLFPNQCRVSNLIKFENHIDFVQAPYYLNYFGLKFKFSSYMGYSQIEFDKSIMKYKNLAKNYYEMIWYRILNDYIERRKNGQKALVFFSLVGMCTAFVEFLRNKEEVIKGKLKVGRYTQEDPYSVISESDIIVSTRKSLGVAIDIPGLISVYDTICERSLKGNLQAIGRLRKIDGVKTIYYNIYAKNLLPQSGMAKTRMNQCKVVCKSFSFSDFGEVDNEM